VLHRNAALVPQARLKLARLTVDEHWPTRRAAERFHVYFTTAKVGAPRGGTCRQREEAELQLLGRDGEVGDGHCGRLHRLCGSGGRVTGGGANRRPVAVEQGSAGQALSSSCSGALARVRSSWYQVPCRPVTFVQAVSNPVRCLSSAPMGAATRKAKAAG
jgi:hypothetical protein